eukprot:6491900-Amphidinium_carterae.2
MQVDETSFGVTEKGSGQAGEEVPFLQAFGGNWLCTFWGQTSATSRFCIGGEGMGSFFHSVLLQAWYVASMQAW